MSLYGDYLHEFGLTEILEIESGFATYRYINNGKTVYIVDIYVAPVCRDGGIATELANTIAMEARERGCKEMWGSVVPSANAATASVRVLLAYGMEICGIKDGHVIFRKDL